MTLPQTGATNWSITLIEQSCIYEMKFLFFYFTNTNSRKLKHWKLSLFCCFHLNASILWNSLRQNISLTPLVTLQILCDTLGVVGGLSEVSPHIRRGAEISYHQLERSVIDLSKIQPVVAHLKGWGERWMSQNVTRIKRGLKMKHFFRQSILKKSFLVLNYTSVELKCVTSRLNSDPGGLRLHKCLSTVQRFVARKCNLGSQSSIVGQKQFFNEMQKFGLKLVDWYGLG